jgi:Tfp pilus assembly protein PilV
MVRHQHRTEGGLTLPELMITTLVVAVFFSGVFELSATCLRYISASKENIAAIESVHDRLEQLRNIDFASLTDPNFLAVTPAVPSPSPSPSPPQRRNLTTPANESELARFATEEVTISTFNGTSATTPRVKFTRVAGAKINSATPFSDTNVAPTVVWTGGTSLAAATAVQIDVTYKWSSTFGARQRSETSTTIVSAGAKK